MVSSLLPSAPQTNIPLPILEALVERLRPRSPLKKHALKEQFLHKTFHPKDGYQLTRKAYSRRRRVFPTERSSTGPGGKNAKKQRKVNRYIYHRHYSTIIPRTEVSTKT